MASESLAEAGRAVLARAEQNQDHEERFASQPGLWTRRARATQLLILVNLALFGLEIALGGSTSPEALARLGDLSYSAFKEGEWWRLVSSLFLHYGPIHLSVNLFALVWLGPFVESVLGFWRFLIVYLASGVGASAAVLVRMAQLDSDDPLVGASGSIMGLLGAMAAIAWRGWRRERARPASRRLLFIAIIISSEVIFDWLTPLVSMTAHLAGLGLGFVVACLFRHGDNARVERPGPVGTAPASDETS